MPAAPHVLFAGGGSPSHLHPGMAVAEHLRRRLPNLQITFAGSGAARERHAVRVAGYHYTTIPAQGRPRNPLQAVRFVTDNVAGYCAARWMLREQRVSLVVGLGGSTSVAVVRGAFVRGIPVVLMEQNAIPGRTTRWLSRAATMICAGFEEVRPHLHVQAPISVTGVPTRTAFEDLYVRTYGRINPQQSGPGPAQTPRTPLHLAADSSRRQKRLVILGGSTGAKLLNEAIPAAIKKLGERMLGWQVVHQTGDLQLQETEARYAQLGIRVLTVAHIDELASVLFASDVVVARAGGSTLAEIAMAGVPAVLLPYPQAADQHQLANARVYAAAAACRVVDETQHAAALDEGIYRQLEPLVSDHHVRSEMARNMQRLARPQAASQIASAITDQLCGGVAGLLAA